MPFSESVFDKSIKKLIVSTHYNNFLDVGCGSGKYGKLIKAINPKAKVIGIEPDISYVKEFGLAKIYDNVITDKVEDFADKNPDYMTEMVIFGDSLEHLKKSDGIDVINFFVYRAKTIVVIYPNKFIQLSWKGHKLEAHRSVWSKSDFKNFNHHIDSKGYMSMIVVQAYLSDPESLAEVGVKKVMKNLKIS